MAERLSLTLEPVTGLPGGTGITRMTTTKRPCIRNRAAPPSPAPATVPPPPNHRRPLVRRGRGTAQRAREPRRAGRPRPEPRAGRTGWFERLGGAVWATRAR